MILTHAALYEALKQPAFIIDPEIKLLQECAARSRRLVEIGCAYGGSTVVLLTAMPKGAHLTSVDSFVKDSMGDLHASEGECIEAVYRALHNLGYEGEVEWKLLAQESAVAAQFWIDSIDFLFIDGGHGAFDVNQDWELWTPFLIRGGLALLHDSRRLSGFPEDEYVQGWRFPTELADYLRTNRDWKLLDEAGSLTVWQKL